MRDGFLFLGLKIVRRSENEDAVDDYSLHVISL
jgi:hypothetical protein